MDLCDTPLKTYPSVFAVGDTYQILVSVSCNTVMWVKVGDKEYYDHSNGVLRSDTTIHKMILPKNELDEAGEYEILLRRIIERKTYYSETGEIESLKFKFYPLKSGDINIYNISDAHNMLDTPKRAGEFFGDDLDLLILNGDVIDHSANISVFDNIYDIAGHITKGEKPVIFSRGNHDHRGVCAEKLSSYTPNSPFTYYSVRMGDLWCLVLDAGEDKNDDRIEYGNTICCHSYRLEETKFLESIIANKENEYMAEGVKKKIVISHIPFTFVRHIENEIFDYWTKLIDEKIKPDFYLCGHTHKCEIVRPSDERYLYGQSCPTIIGSTPDRGEIQRFTGCAIEYKGEKIIVSYTNEEKKVVASEEV